MSLVACRGPAAGQRDVACAAAKGPGGRRTKGAAGGRRGGGGGGGGGAGGPGRSSSSAVPKMSSAAKEAAKRANAFSQLRFERARVAPPPSSSAAVAVAADVERDAEGEGRRPSRRLGLAPGDAATASAQELRPFVETVVQHLRRAGALAAGDAEAGSGSGSDDDGGGSEGDGGDGRQGRGRGRGSKRGAARSLLEQHTAVFQAALDLELQEEWAEAEERLQSWPAARLSSEGMALFGLAAAPDGGLFRDVLLKFFVPSRPLPFHAFSQGDILLVSRGDPLADALEAVVVDFSARWIRLALSPTAAASVAAAGRGAAWRLDLFANTVTHERCSEALQRFADGARGGGGGEARAGGLAGQAEAQQQEALWRVLAGAVLPGQSMEKAAALAPPWVRSPQGRERLAAARSGVRALARAGDLNGSQAKAVEAALARTVTLWQGPPGTGKTTTLLRCCQAALRVLQPSGGRLLAVAASNVAVDNIVAGLLALGVSVCRLGQPVKVTPALRSVTLEVLAAATPAGQEAARLRQQLVAAAAARATGGSGGGGRGRRGSEGAAGRRGNGGRSGGGGGSGLGGLWEQMIALEAAAAAEVLGSVQVVAATCVGAGDPVLAERCFELVVVDEATQAPEPAALVAVAAKAQALVMVGDPRQLPPTVKCRRAEALGLGVSLFDRLQAMGLAPLLLDVQYRSHPELMCFPAEQFYGGRLRSWPTPEDRPLPPGLPWPNPHVPVLFLQCCGPESRTAASPGAGGRAAREAGPGSSGSSSGGSSGSDRDSPGGSRDEGGGGGGPRAAAPAPAGGHSYANVSEAAAVVRCLRRLLAPGRLAPADVGVITPYSGQVRAIQQLIAADGGARRGGAGAAGAEGAEGAAGVEVKSVDGFQGREKEVIIFSAVRSNAAGRVGFLSDARRLNVALTRARRGLVVVGDAATLRADGVWARWLGWAEARGVVTAVSAALGPPAP